MKPIIHNYQGPRRSPQTPHLTSPRLTSPHPRAHSKVRRDPALDCPVQQQWLKTTPKQTEVLFSLDHNGVMSPSAMSYCFRMTQSVCLSSTGSQIPAFQSGMTAANGHCLLALAQHRLRTATPSDRRVSDRSSRQEPMIACWNREQGNRDSLSLPVTSTNKSRSHRGHGTGQRSPKYPAASPPPPNTAPRTDLDQQTRHRRDMVLDTDCTTRYPISLFGTPPPPPPAGIPPKQRSVPASFIQPAETCSLGWYLEMRSAPADQQPDLLAVQAPERVRQVEHVDFGLRDLLEACVDFRSVFLATAMRLMDTS